jgi:hypothetical protein
MLLRMGNESVNAPGNPNKEPRVKDDQNSAYIWLFTLSSSSVYPSLSFRATSVNSVSPW